MRPFDKSKKQQPQRAPATVPARQVREGPHLHKDIIFDKKPFLIIVGTLENKFYIIESFQVIYELNVCYLYENIFDLNVQNFGKEEDVDDFGNLKETIDSLEHGEIDSKLRDISLLTTSPKMLGAVESLTTENNQPVYTRSTE